MVDCLICRQEIYTKTKKVTKCCKTAYAHKKCYSMWIRSGSGMCPNCGNVLSKKRNEEYKLELTKSDYIVESTFNTRIQEIEDSLIQLELELIRMSI